MISLIIEIFIYVWILSFIKYVIFLNKKITYSEWRNEIILWIIMFFIINFSMNIFFHDLIVTFFADSFWMFLSDMKSTIQNTSIIIFTLKVAISIIVIPLIVLFLNKQFNSTSTLTKIKHYFILNLSLFIFVYIFYLFITFGIWLEVYTKPFLLK